ncbi:MAG TPA: metalloregulator ArsR/SmtB family transcription factor [Blastocatellia bacterium]|nr:metalloregulator ArsR/SmtB family transcription factor [Blastocatellia bacterium]
MAGTKVLTPEAMNLVAARFKILSDPMRLRILNTLQNGEQSVTQVTETVAASQPNVSKHLKTLQDAGLIARRQEGNTVYYRVADETVFQLCDVVCNSIQQHLTAQASVFGRNQKAKGKS